MFMVIRAMYPVLLIVVTVIFALVKKLRRNGIFDRTACSVILL